MFFSFHLHFHSPLLFFSRKYKNGKWFSFPYEIHFFCQIESKTLSIFRFRSQEGTRFQFGRFFFTNKPLYKWNWFALWGCPFFFLLKKKKKVVTFSKRQIEIIIFFFFFRKKMRSWWMCFVSMMMSLENFAIRGTVCRPVAVCVCVWFPLPVASCFQF